MEYINKILQGDCLEVMKGFPDNTFDTIITDPPYGLGFMGKQWDTFDKNQFGKAGEEGQNDLKVKKNFNILPRYKTDGLYDFTKNWAKECLRVLKPGGTALIFAGSRTQHKIACGVEDAGFILKDCIMWLYGSGFPKATDISLQFDKDACVKQLAEKLGRKPTKEEFKKEWKEFRKVVGKGASQPAKSGHFGGETGEHINYSDEGRFSPDVTAPKTPEAILWNGWKSHGLKPAYEPILVCLKPNEGSYANNALKWGVAGLNIDGGRIGTNDNLNGGIYSGKGKCKTVADHQWGFQKRDGQYKQPTGRFPANIIHDGSEEVVSKFPNTGTSYRPNSRRGKVKSDIYMDGLVRDGYPTALGVDDSGSASRFFYCAKASKAERNRGCEGLDIPEYRWKNGGICQQIKGQKGNCHPTVKPLSLMKYLCTITKTPTGGIVLDPFCGSGTTLMACKGTGRDYIGIEKDKEYVEIARRRISAIPELLPFEGVLC